MYDDDVAAICPAKKVALERIEVDIQHDRIHADDAVNVEQIGGMVEQFKIDLVLHGDLDSAQLERLSEISTRCPVRNIFAGNHVFS